MSLPAEYVSLFLCGGFNWPRRWWYISETKIFFSLLFSGTVNRVMATAQETLIVHDGAIVKQAGYA